MAHKGSLGPNVTSIDSGDHRERVLRQRDELVCDHLDLVRVIARRIHASLPPSFDLDDLYAEGYRALMVAATRYRPDAHGGAPFSAYARPVIRGAIYDSVTGKAYRESTAVEIEADEMAETLLSGEEMFDRHRMSERLQAAIARLAPRQAEVVREYYTADEPGLKTVARRLRSSYGVVWQLHAEAIRELRAMLDDEAA